MKVSRGLLLLVASFCLVSLPATALAQGSAESGSTGDETTESDPSAETSPADDEGTSDAKADSEGTGESDESEEASSASGSDSADANPDSDGTTGTSKTVEANPSEKAHAEMGMLNVDAMVAAVADTADEPVVTDNVSDFRQLGVEVEPF